MRQRVAKHNAPQLCVLQVFACTFHHAKMLLVWTVREMGKETDGMANVKLACNAGKHKFPKNVSTGETFLRFFGFRHLFESSFESSQAVGYSWLDWTRHRTFMFIGCRGIPSMCLEHVINVGLATQLDTVSSLKDVNAIALVVKFQCPWWHIQLGSAHRSLW